MKSAKDIFLILASISFVIVLGGAVYEHLSTIPKWSAAPPKSFAMFHGEYASDPRVFWQSIHPVTLLLMIGALITNWRTSRKKNIMMVLGGYVLILAITAVYFIPNLMGFMETPYQDTVDEALVSKASMWETLSIVRMLFILALAYMLVSTLTRSRDEIVVVQPSNAVPLSYPNDALGG